MGIGFRELIILMLMFAVLCFVIGCAIWRVIRRNRGSLSPAGQRPVAERLAELESLRRAGQIDTSEYEKQRASIIAGI